MDHVFSRSMEGCRSGRTGSPSIPEYAVASRDVIFLRLTAPLQRARRATKDLMGRA